MKIRDIYKFDIIDEINAGNIAYVVDKLEGHINSANYLSVDVYAKIMNHDNADNRYDFYVIEGK